MAEYSLEHLKAQVRNGNLVLFTGAGFSLNAKNLEGTNLPLASELAKEIWKLCYPEEPFDPQSTLQDLYQAALTRNRNALASLLQRKLTVRSESLPSFYAVWLAIPWERVYTLNIDDLPRAVDRQFGLPRSPASISGVDPKSKPPPSRDNRSVLEIIHLNGTLDDAPAGVTFSTTQYSQRLARHDATYERLVSDLASHPFVFVGTNLDETPLWQHIEMRGERGARNLRELRPRSYLISPSLSRARRDLLEEYNVIWIQQTAEEFAAELEEMHHESQLGHQRHAKASRRVLSPYSIPFVDELIKNSNTNKSSQFLIGAEPEWHDIQTGRAIPRTHDSQLLLVASSLIESSGDGKNTASGQNKLLVITGTAASGKSTGLMRLAAALSAAGSRVAWIGSDTEPSAREIRLLAQSQDRLPDVIAIDEADRYGSELAAIVSDLTVIPHIRLIVVAVRGSKMARVLPPDRLPYPVHEESVPGLSDHDIEALLESLDRDNKLGALKGLSHPVRVSKLREKSGRQLLVAMMEATSGQRFEEKVLDEWRDLQDEGQAVYGLITLATSLRAHLQKDEVLIGLGDIAGGLHGNEILNTLENLANRHIIVGKEENRYRTRHRHIADVLLEALEASGQLETLHIRLAYVAAAKFGHLQQRSDKRAWLLKRLINHDFLFNRIGLTGARKLYDRVEHFLAWDYHYLLQRGSLEVEAGDIHAAENYLAQACSMAESDPYVRTAYAYMLFKRATTNPSALGATGWVDEAVSILVDQIESRGKEDRFPAHVLGSQTLSWIRRGNIILSEKERFLRMVHRHVRQVAQYHPRETDINELARDVQRQLLGIAI